MNGGGKAPECLFFTTALSTVIPTACHSSMSTHEVPGTVVVFPRLPSFCASANESFTIQPKHHFLFSLTLPALTPQAWVWWILHGSRARAQHHVSVYLSVSPINPSRDGLKCYGNPHRAWNIELLLIHICLLDEGHLYFATLVSRVCKHMKNKRDSITNPRRIMTNA